MSNLHVIIVVSIVDSIDEKVLSISSVLVEYSSIVLMIVSAKSMRKCRFLDYAHVLLANVGGSLIAIILNNINFDVETFSEI
jgi:hypothetical protein